MAFPAVQTADTKNGVVTSNSTSWTLTYPTNIAAGDLILALVASDGNQVFGTWPAGWIVEGGSGGGAAVTGLYAKKLATGSETGNFSVTSLNSEQGSWRIFRITGWEGTLGSAFGNLSSAGSVVRVVTELGASANPDPPDLNPNNWATEDTLWIASCAVDTSRTISVYPLADLNTADVSGGSTGATLGICMANDAVASKNPGTFTISASDDWAAVTIGVRPATTVARVPKTPSFQPFLAQ